MRNKPLTLLAALALLTAAACGGESQAPANKPSSGSKTPSPAGAASSSAPAKKLDLLPGMPRPPQPDDVYAATRPGKLSPAMQGVRNLVYVPNNLDDTVSVINPDTFEVINTFPAGDGPQHVVPSYDLSTLYVTSSKLPGGSLTPIDPKTGKPGETFPIRDPYNLYFTPNGKYAIVVAEAFRRLEFYDPKTWEKKASLHIPKCAGINHMDFTENGKLALISCEFANRMVVVDVQAKKHIRTIELHQVPNGKPQDCRLSPDGEQFYVADMMADGVYVFNGEATKQIGFIPTGKGAHGLYFSRDSQRLFVSNRGEGSVSVIDTDTNKIIDTWEIPGGGSPDMGSVSADGTQLWLAGRYHSEVYVFDTSTGEVLAQIPVGNGPHGLTYMPQPGRYSLGHTSNFR